MKRTAIYRSLSAVTLIVTLFAVSTVSSAGASPSPGLKSMGTSIDSEPAGCPLGYFCSYNQGNGGDLCFKSLPGQINLTSLCADANDSVYNNTSVPVNVYYFTGQTGAYLTVSARGYLLNMTSNFFNRCINGGSLCAGYGQATAYNVESIGVE